MIGETTREVIKTVANTGKEILKVGLIEAKKDAQKVIKEPVRRMLNFFRPGRNPDNVLKNLASVSTTKDTTSNFNRMLPPQVWRGGEDDDEKKRDKQNQQTVNKTQIGVINIG